ncbi:hypothetical protein AWB85_15525 [Mycobacteroides immunogenum]|uniref:Polyketide cyclase n=1 Tax=Mycobacteroides immunogenum TaxID=83262 RepID=A0A179V522_9MYCO|nr:hypothetical protein AWB85_15525 [Mycobacteroides immunogenum]
MVSSAAVKIDAAARTVWQVLTDLHDYPIWNPLCMSAESTLALGDPITMVLANPGHGSLSRTEYICARIEERQLSWEAPSCMQSNGAVRRDHVIECLDEHSCCYRTSIVVTGTGVLDAALPKKYGALELSDFVRALKFRSELLERCAATQ